MSRGQRGWLAAGAGLAVVLVAVAGWRAPHGDSDLVGFHYASRHWLSTGEFTQEYGAQFYFPAFVILMTPIVAGPLAVAGTLMGVVNVALLVLSLRMLARMNARERELPFGVAWLWPIVLGLPFIIDTIVLGQVNLIVVALCVASYRQIRQGRQAFGGGLIGLAAVVKVYPLVFALYWLLKGRWKASAAALAAAVLLAGGLSLAGFGWQQTVDAHRQWREAVGGVKYRAEHGGTKAPVSDLVFSPRWNQWLRHNNQSLAAVVRRLTTDLSDERGPKQPDVAFADLTAHQAGRLYQALAVVLLALLAITTWQRRATCSAGEWSAWLASVVAFVPVFWTHYFVLLLPLLAVMTVGVWRAEEEGKPSLRPRLLLAVWVVGFALLASDRCRLVGVHCWLALALAAWALSLRSGLAKGSTQIDGRGSRPGVDAPG